MRHNLGAEMSAYNFQVMSKSILLSNVIKSSGNSLACCWNGVAWNRRNWNSDNGSIRHSVRLREKIAMYGNDSKIKTNTLLSVNYVPSVHSIREKTISLSAKDIVAASPASVKPYLELMRMDRPIGNWLVFLPCAWSISLATPAGHLPDLSLLTLCAMGAFFMRGAGCTINDIWDKDFDSKVSRTRSRPLASGRISRMQALTFLSLPLSASLAILCTMNTNTILLGFCAVLPCVIYPFMKRITYWPQVFLGLTFNWGVLIGWSAVQGHLGLAPVSMYLSCLAWTVVYDTIYAFQDKEDDMKIGVKSTALRMGDSTKLWLSGFSGCTVAALTTAGLFSDQTWPYYLGVAYFASHLAHQLYTVDLRNAEDCGKKFFSNRNLGLVFWLAVIASNLLKKEKEDSNLKSENIPV